MYTELRSSLNNQAKEFLKAAFPAKFKDLQRINQKKHFLIGQLVKIKQSPAPPQNRRIFKTFQSATN